MIQYILIISQYMKDRSIRENHTILVEADDENKAEQTVEAYWESKSDQYGIKYSVQKQEVITSIKQEDYLNLNLDIKEKEKNNRNEKNNKKTVNKGVRTL